MNEFQRNDSTLNDLYSSKPAKSPPKLSAVLTSMHSDKDTNDSENMELEMPIVQPKLCKVKTQLCQYFLAGYCQKGNNCCFAHGNDQLKAAPKYKKCMYGKRYCKFGAQCRFLHEDEFDEYSKQQSM